MQDNFDVYSWNRKMRLNEEYQGNQSTRYNSLLTDLNKIMDKYDTTLTESDLKQKLRDIISELEQQISDNF